MKRYYFFYREHKGNGDAVFCDTAEEAVKMAKDEWDFLCVSDKERFFNDPCGTFCAGVMDSEDEEPPITDYNYLWSALSTREKLRVNGENLGWCKPYYDYDSGKTYTVNEGIVQELDEQPADLADFLDWMEEKGCKDCPHFETCEALNE